MKKISIILIISLGFFGCTKNQDYPYIIGFSTYMKEVHGINISTLDGDNIFYFIALRSCDNCVEINLNMLLSLEESKEITIFFLGQTDSETWNNSISMLTKKFNCKFDPKSKMLRYETGMGKPLLMHFKSSDYKYHLEVSDFEIDQAKEYLEKVLSS